MKNLVLVSAAMVIALTAAPTFAEAAAPTTPVHTVKKAHKAKVHKAKVKPAAKPTGK